MYIWMCLYCGIVNVDNYEEEDDDNRKIINNVLALYWIND